MYQFQQVLWNVVEFFVFEFGAVFFSVLYAMRINKKWHPLRNFSFKLNYSIVRFVNVVCCIFLSAVNMTQHHCFKYVFVFNSRSNARSHASHFERIISLLLLVCVSVVFILSHDDCRIDGAKWRNEKKASHRCSVPIW